MSISYKDFQVGTRVRFKEDYFDQASFAYEKPTIPTPAKKDDLGTVTRVSGNISTITLAKGATVRIFKSIDGNVEPWEKYDSLEIVT
ncbi:hypothetical protein HQ571_02555 [Candidatus Kuenenbacteria bacterium]|nr:hypothetical protein [Candidatus Kuenenbacteria bacterium]